jgi:hypothetical protein
LGDTVAEREGIDAALESVWKAKREYRAELGRKRALRFLRYRRFTGGVAIIPKPHESSVREVSMPKPKSLADEVLDSLECKGLVEKSGISRTAPNGEVQPVWRLTPLGKWLSETGQLDNYLATWNTDLKSS